MSEDELVESLGLCGCTSDETADLLVQILKAADCCQVGALEVDVRLLELGVHALERVGLVQHGSSCRCPLMTEQGRDFVSRLYVEGAP